MTEEEFPAENVEASGANDGLTTEIGETAIDSVARPNFTADEAVKIDEERQANQAGWEAVAEKINDDRSLHEKLRDKNEVSAEGVMVDEAQRANAEIDAWRKDYPYEAGGLSNQEIYEKLKAEEQSQREGRQRPNYDGEHHGQHTDNEPIYTPKTEESYHLRGSEIESSAHEIRLREERTKPVAEKVLKALASGDIKAAEKALAESAEKPFRDERFDPLTMERMIHSALTETLGASLKSGPNHHLGELLDSRQLSEFLNPGMAKEAGVGEVSLEMRQPYLRKKALEILDQDRPLTPEDTEEMSRRLDVLTRVGVLTKEQIKSDNTIRDQVKKLVTSAITDRILEHPAYGLRVPRSEVIFEQMGLITRPELIKDNWILETVAAGQLAMQDSELRERAKAKLRQEYLGEGEAKQAA